MRRGYARSVANFTPMLRSPCHKAPICRTICAHFAGSCVHPLDATARALPRRLRTEARRRKAGRPESAGLPPPACLRRLRLRNPRGVTRGYPVVLEAPPQGEGVVVIVQI